MTETNPSPTPAPNVVPTPASSIVPKWVPPVIFLDFEGVLCFSDGTWSLEAMDELNRLCLETGAGVVLTTFGRYGSTVEELHRTLLLNGIDEAGRKTLAVWRDQGV